MPREYHNEDGYENEEADSKYNIALQNKKPKYGGSNPFLNPNLGNSNIKKRRKKRKNKGNNALVANESEMNIVIANGNGDCYNNKNDTLTNGYSNGSSCNKIKLKDKQTEIPEKKKCKKNIQTEFHDKKKFRQNKQYECSDWNTILKQRQGLPISEVRDEVIEQLTKYETSIIIGETGSGKTTQIPQFLHEERLDVEGAICITQPRRVAAITIAKRVAQEMNTEIGNIVGYSVRFEECCTHRSKLKYVTDGMLLREALSDSLLSKYKWIILDEAHERSINTDTLFGVIKEAQRKRKLKNKSTLHIIVMSATMDVNHFSSYFNDAPIFYIEGRQYPIEVFNSRSHNDDYTVDCLSTMLKIHREANSEEDILIFLTGQEEIDYAVQLILNIAKDPSLSNYPIIKAFPLYAALPHHLQLKVFAPSVPGERKVIVSTNIAETSITIPGIKYVIDCGHAKVRTYNSMSGFNDLKVCRISQSQAWQRTGRAGREAPGVCYRTYTNEEFDLMDINTVPEILRANLSSVFLKLLAIGIKDVLNFDFIDKPPMENLKQAQHTLKGLKAIELNGEEAVLTDIGKKMSLFPLEPHYAKLLINGPSYSCTEEMLTIIAILSSESIFVNPTERKDEAREKRQKFKAAEGDHITLLNIYKAFTASTNKKTWCRKNFLNLRNLSYASDVRRQLEELCNKNKIALVSCNEKPEPVLRCLISGLYKNVGEVTFGNKFKVLNSSEFAKIHPSSTMFGRTPDYIIFTELLKTGNTFMHLNSEVKGEWLMEFNPEYFRSKHMRTLNY